MPVAVSCVVCGTVSLVTPGRATSRRYCSKPCQHIGRTRGRVQICATCGSFFRRSPSASNRGARPSCSISCALSARHPPIEERFWAKVDKNGPRAAHVPELGPCWIWTAARHPDGYGIFDFDGRPRGAHIFAYILEHGALSEEAPCVLHACDGGAIGCVRPSHLFAGTLADNNRDMAAKGRAWWSKS